nr:MAG TPA: hypothetical protein [Caudoviricetes sp.]
MLKVCNPGDWLLLVVFFVVFFLRPIHSQHNARQDGQAAKAYKRYRQPPKPLRN